MAQLGTLGGLNALGRGVDRVAESQRNLNALQNVVISKIQSPNKPTTI